MLLLEEMCIEICHLSFARSFLLAGLSRTFVVRILYTLHIYLILLYCYYYYIQHLNTIHETRQQDDARALLYAYIKIYYYYYAATAAQLLLLHASYSF